MELNNTELKTNVTQEETPLEFTATTEDVITEEEAAKGLSEEQTVLSGGFEDYVKQAMMTPDETEEV